VPVALEYVEWAVPMSGMCEVRRASNCRRDSMCLVPLTICIYIKQSC
jgi:hypothetical protein